MLNPSPVFYEKGLRFECTGCGACCKTHGDYAYVYLNDKDQTAAASLLKLKLVDFLNAHCRTDANGNVHLTMVEGNCNFLDGEDRCRIYAVRPMQCRTWPFWTENLIEEEWNGPVTQCCPGIGKGRLYSKEEIERIAKERDDWYGIDF